MMERGLGVRMASPPLQPTTLSMDFLPFFAFSPLSTLLVLRGHLLGLSGAGEGVELVCAPGERAARGRQAGMAHSAPQHPIPHLREGARVFAGLVATPRQLVISVCAQTGTFSSGVHGDSFFSCCLIINHLNGDVNSHSHLHPHQQREPSDLFTHHRSKKGYLANTPGREISLLLSTFATSALLDLRSQWKVMLC